MREIRSSGSVEGVVSNHDPYSDCIEIGRRITPFDSHTTTTPGSTIFEANLDIYAEAKIASFRLIRFTLKLLRCA